MARKKRMAVKGRKTKKIETGSISKVSGGQMNLWIWILLCIFVVTVFVIRWRLNSIPLERDEGEFAYMGQLILRGIPPYELAYNMKFPGTYFMYALVIGIFGQSTEGIHFGLAMVNGVSVLLLFLIAREFMSSISALMAAITFGILCLGSTVVGFALHATHFVTLFALAAIWVMMLAFQKEKSWLYFLSGFLFCLAFIMKQSGIFFLLFGGLTLVIHFWFFKGNALKNRMRYLLSFVLGAIIPVAFIFPDILGVGEVSSYGSARGIRTTNID